MERSWRSRCMTRLQVRNTRHAQLQGPGRRHAFHSQRRSWHRALQQSARFCRCDTRHDRGDRRRSRQACRGSAVPGQSFRRPRRLQAQRRCDGHDAEGLQAGFRPVPRGRLAGLVRTGRIRRPGPALYAPHGHWRIYVIRQHGADHVSGPHPGRHCRHPRARHRRAEGNLPAENGRRRLDRHDEPDGAPLRYRSRPAPLQGRAAGRRLLQDFRPENLHLRWRTRHGRQYHPPGSRPYRGCTGRCEGHFAVHRAEIPCGGRWCAWRAQHRFLRCDRAQDGHSRQLDLRHEL